MSESVPQNRSVHFSAADSERIDIPRDNPEEKYYSSNDIQRFKQLLVQDVQNMAALLRTTPISSLTNDQLYQCTGIESFLSRDVVARTVASIRAHMTVIVFVQNHFTPDAVSRVSMISSRWFRNRAQRRAADYQEQLAADAG